MPLTTELDIVNAALRKVGARAIAAISDTTAAGAIAGDVLVSERDALLRAYTWNFAVARADLTPLASVPTFEFAVAFALPTDWLRTIAVYNKTTFTSQPRYKMETVSVASVFTRCIACDSDDVYLRYVRQCSGDAGVVLMSAMFQELLILRLARVFASGLANSNTLLQLIDKEYQQAFEKAKLSDEVEDYLDSVDSSFWGAQIINDAILQLRIRRSSTEELQIQGGIIAHALLERETDDLLRSHTWNFATARTVLLNSEVNSGFAWENVFIVPSDWLRTIGVYDNSIGVGRLQYRMESVYTDQYLENRGFDADSAWTKGTGWTISGGKATHAAGTASSLEQSGATVSLTAGSPYRVSFTVSGRSAGAVTPRFTVGTTVTGTVVDSNVTSGQELTAVSGNTTFGLLASSDFDGSVDDVYLYRVDGTTEQAILTDATEVWIHYVKQIRSVSAMSAPFRKLLTLRMAKIFAAGVENGMNIVQLLDREERRALNEAKGVDGIEDLQDERPEGSWIQARRGGWRRGNSVHGT